MIKKFTFGNHAVDEPRAQSDDFGINNQEAKKIVDEYKNSLPVGMLMAVQGDFFWVSYEVPENCAGYKYANHVSLKQPNNVFRMQANYVCNMIYKMAVKINKKYTVENKMQGAA